MHNEDEDENHTAEPSKKVRRKKWNPLVDEWDEKEYYKLLNKKHEPKQRGNFS